MTRRAREGPAAEPAAQPALETTGGLEAPEDEPIRRRLGWRGEVALAVLPTLTVLLVLAFLEALTRQQVLFASLAGSAFLIYLDPEHPTNRVRTLALAHLGAAALGFAAQALLGTSYAASAVALVATILLLVSFDLVHPPAVATALSFAFRDEADSAVVVFGLAVGAMAGLVLLEHATLRLFKRLTRHHGARGGPQSSSVPS